jgi:beta-xylosidase
MKKLLLLVVLISSIACTQTEKKEFENTILRTYTNPLDVSIGDPHILRAKDGRYYMTGTGGGRDSTAYPAYYSDNLIDWVSIGDLYHRDPTTSWCTGSFWAPELYLINDKYYMFYSADWRFNPNNEGENFRIGVAVSDKPDGPYRDIRNEPIFDPGYPIIDANVMVDTDGRFYLYYSRCCYKHPVESELADWARAINMYNEIEESWIYGIELKPDFSGVIGEPVVLIRPPVSLSETKDSWEDRSVVNRESNRRWTEAATSFKYGSTYYIMYSANSVAANNYDIGYATSENPLGPFKKAENNPVTETKGDVISPGHNCVVFSPDGSEMYCVYGAKSMRLAIKNALSGSSRSTRIQGSGAPGGVSGQPAEAVTSVQGVPSGFIGQGPPTSYMRMRRTLYIDRMEIMSDGKLLVNCGDTSPQPVPFDK